MREAIGRMKTCEMTCSDGGKVTGHENYYKCGKPAKAIIKKRPGPGTKFVCGIHARAHDKIAAKHGFEPSKPLQDVVEPAK